MIISSPVYGVTFPPEVIVDPPYAPMQEASFTPYATSVLARIPFVEGFDRYWVEWCANVNFTGTYHVAGFVTPGTDFDTTGDLYSRSVTGFEPESLWYFRVRASDSSEYPDYTPEQWN